MPGEGLLIEHVDDAKNNNTDENHYLVDIEQADGRRDLNLNANRGDGSDPFPTAANAGFTGTSSPNSNGYNGAASNVSVTKITRVGDNITADIQVGTAVVAGRQWSYNRAVVSAYAHHTSQWAWANIAGLAGEGQRRCRRRRDQHVRQPVSAAANGRLVHVEADGQLLYTMYLV